MTIPHHYDNATTSTPLIGVRIDIRPSLSFCQYSKVRSNNFYRHFFRGSTLLDGVRTKHWWRTQTKGGVYFINSSECVDITIYTITERDNVNRLIRDFKYRLKSIMWSSPLIEIVEVEDFPSQSGGQTFGLMYLLRKEQNVKTKPTTIHENQGEEIRI